MRSVYVCQNCAVHYLPPETMTYPNSGITASTVHCANPRCARAIADGTAIALPPELLARLQPAGDEQPRAPRVRRPVRGRRAAAAPKAARSRLH